MIKTSEKIEQIVKEYEIAKEKWEKVYNVINAAKEKWRITAEKLPEFKKWYDATQEHMKVLDSLRNKVVDMNNYRSDPDVIKEQSLQCKEKHFRTRYESVSKQLPEYHFVLALEKIIDNGGWIND